MTPPAKRVLAKSVLAKRSLAAALVAIAACLAAGPASAGPPRAHDLDGIDRTARSAYESGGYGFCTTPATPLGARQRATCPLAAELDGCEGLQRACGALPTPEEPSWLERLLRWAAPAATVIVYLLVAAIVVVIAVPVVRALRRLRRERPRPEPRARGRAVVQPEVPAVPALTDAEEALQLADDHRARGELGRALALYLHAALTALDRRGAIRVARHRTNGEYVRTCAEATSRAALREIVREVDRVQFGGAAPTGDALSHVATKARSIVHALTAAIAIVAVLGTGCAGPKRGSDPAGDELPIEILRRNGFRVGRLESSLATMPVPDGDEGTPVVVVDVERVLLEDEAQAHLMRWVEAGGVLALFGRIDRWPNELRPRHAAAETRDLSIRTSDPNGGLLDMDDLDDEDDDDAQTVVVPAPGAPITFAGARAARRDAMEWEGAHAIAFLGERTYAAKKRVGKGLVLGVANDDLFTNVGVLPPRNAAALVTLVRSVSHDLHRRVGVGPDGRSTLTDVRVARAEDGIPPPANPFAALIAAGLGTGAWHALVASLLLFLAVGVRHARPRPLSPESRRAFAEHVAATGALYARAGAHVHALVAYGRFVEARLRERMPHGGDPVALLASRGADPARAAELYARATQAKPDDPPRGDELAVIEELRRLL